MAHGSRDYYFWDMPLSVPTGGTGATTLALNGVLLGNGTSSINVTAAGDPNSVLRVPGGGGAPAFSLLGALADKSSIDLTVDVGATILPKANGGTGTNTPALVAGTGIQITGTWPANTIINSSPYAALSDPLTIAHGGTGSSTANLAAGTGIQITGTWPNQTIINTSAFAALADPLTVAHGGTGTTTPALVQGANIIITGAWPNQTIALSATPSVTRITLTGTGTSITFHDLVGTSNPMTMDGRANIVAPSDTTAGQYWSVVDKLNQSVIAVWLDGTANLQLFNPLKVTSGGTGSTGGTAGQILVAAGVNAASFVTPDGCRAYHNAAQNIGTGAWAAIALNSERWDNGTMHSNVTNNSRLTCHTAGKYMITGHIQWSGSAAGTQRGVAIVLNGGTFLASQVVPPFANAFNISVATLWHLEYNDYVELFAYQDTGGGLNVNAAGDSSPEFAAQWVGA